MDTEGRPMSQGSVIAGFIVPGKPHILLSPNDNEGWSSLNRSYGLLKQKIKELSPDLILLYSTGWPSIIGHQIQADPWPEWDLVDQDFHQLGTIKYKLRISPEFGNAYLKAAKERGLTARTVAYHGFPVDTGTVVALSLLNPDNEFPASIVSCNMYADRGETIVLGKAALDAIKSSGKRVVVVAVTAFSNRHFTDWIDPKDDHIHSAKDDEWNRKLLELLDQGRLEDVAQLARTFSRQAHGDSRMKAIWWLSAVMGQHNDFEGTVFDYQPVFGTGAALVGLTPSETGGSDLEYDEDDVEVYKGDRNVLGSR